jgi:hypothetical protein
MNQGPDKPRLVAQIVMQIGWALCLCGCLAAILIPLGLLVWGMLSGKPAAP